MELTQLLPIDKWSKIETDIYKKFNLQGSLFNTEGVRVTDTKNWSNALCPVIKSTDKGQSYICAVAHMNMAKQAENKKHPVIEECDAGMIKLVVPIFVDQEYLGVLGGCGMLPEDGEIDTFSVQKITDIDGDKIDRLSSGVPVIDFQTAQQAAGFIEDQLDMVIKAYENSEIA